MILVVLLQHPKVPAVASTLWIDCVSSVLIQDLGGKETDFGLRATPRLVKSRVQTAKAGTRNNLEAHCMRIANY